MIRKTVKKLVRKNVAAIQGLRFRNSRKIFCVGHNKTGTTSMEKLFSQMGFYTASQQQAELLADNWLNQDYEPIVKFVKYGGEAFQDVPFSLPGTFRCLDEAFPESKFILTIRDSDEEWYNSVTAFHSKLFGNNTLPTKEQFENFSYVHPGWLWKLHKATYKVPDHDIYNEELMKKYYNLHNSEIIEHFGGDESRLLIINLKEKDAALLISRFVEARNPVSEMPWENKT